MDHSDYLYSCIIINHGKTNWTRRIARPTWALYAFVFGFRSISSAIRLTCVDGPWRRMAAVGSASRISLFVSLWWVYPDGLSAAVLWRVWLSVLRPRCRTSRVPHSSLAWIWSLWKTDIHLCLDLSRIMRKNITRL